MPLQVTSSPAAAGTLRTLQDVPAALLLDFGGVVVETRKRPTGPADIAESVQRILARGGYRLTREQIAASFQAGSAALKHWKHASSRRSHPTELTHREIVGEFLAGDLPKGPRTLLTAEATRVLEIVSLSTNDHPLRPGIPELLGLCARHGIPVGIVSNAHSGSAHRLLLADHGIDHLLAVQVYSDEVGIRKPNPEIIHLAAAALGLTPDQTWYVGDTQDRDVAAGRRAGVGAVVITRSKHTDNPPFAVAHRPDATFDDPRGLLTLLQQVLDDGAAPHRQPVTTPRPGYSQDLAGPSQEGAGSPADHPRTPGPAVLIDHGGVISLTAPGTDGLGRFLEELHQQLARTGLPAPSVEELREALASARAELKVAKADKLAAYREDGEPLREVTHREFWEQVASHLPEQLRPWFSAEAEDLAARYGNVKSDRRVRPGMVDLLEAFARVGTPIVVVSNTVSGRAVRASCERYGLAPHIAAYVCSDEIGLRKPEPGLFREALAIANADPARTIFIGDKPANDAAGARSVGIAHRVLLTGGSTDESELAAALADGTATLVVSDLEDLLFLREEITS
ncbi:MAG TPA: HAD-IA family hydrolase [Actinomycetales bacterium]|nr:HAD-IA family hydrolase [Actinomycetales bacterium]